MADDGSALFRPAALEAARRRIGSPVRPIGLASWVLTLFMVGLIAAILAFLVFAKFSRVSSAPGSVEPMVGASHVLAPRAAVVTSVLVTEGQMVKAGDPLFTLGSNPVMEGGAPLRDVLSSVSETQEQALVAQGEAQTLSYQRQREELGARIKGMRQQSARLREELALLSQRAALDEASLASYQSLRDQRYVSEIRYRAAQAAVLDDKRAESALQRDIDTADAALAEAQAALSRLGAESAQTQASLDGAKAALEERRATTSVETGMIVTAPRAGRVTLQARDGSSIAAGSALAIILPPGTEMKVQLWAPSRAAGFIRPGNEVRLLYDAFPYQRFGVARGRVLSVASAPTAPQDVPLPLEAREALYRVDVALDSQVVAAYGRKWPLAAGSRVTGDIVLESRSLLSWLLDPVLAVKNRRM